MRLILFPLAFLAATPAIAQEQQGEEFAIETVRGDPELVAARARAQEELPHWLEMLGRNSPDMGGFQFQYPLGGYEFIWVENVAREGDTLSGTLAMPPVQQGHSHGERVTVPIGQVTHWMYWTRDNVAHGQFALRVLLPRMEKSRANKLRRDLGWPEE